MTPHPERFWLSNGFSHVPRRRAYSVRLLLALLAFWGLALLGAAMMVWQLVLAVRSLL